MTPVVASLVEAGTQLRIHRVRVLLSLVGVAVAVMALTASVALSDLVRTISVESMEQSSGRPATISFSIWQDNAQIDAAELISESEVIAERYDIEYASPVVWTYGTMNLGGMSTEVSGLGIGPDYQTMHRIELAEGRWLSPGDEDRLAPAVIVNREFLELLGYSSLEQRPTFELADGRTAVIVGIVEGGQFSGIPYLIASATEIDAVFGSPENSSVPQIEMWVPEDQADAVQSTVTRDFQYTFEGAQVDASRMDYAFYAGEEDPTAIMRSILLGISGVVLALGALSLINIAVVTVRQRVREFGIRRAFGASRARVFVGVMLESVVGTTLAGVVGIIVVVLVARLPIVADLVSGGLSDQMPPFPVSAAITGLIVAVVVGVIAGLVPAIVAVRSKVIDAIRF